MIIGIPLWKLIFNPFIFIIEVVLVVAIFVIVERWKSLKKIKFDTKKFTQDIRNSLKRGGTKRAMEICESEDHPLANVLLEGIRNASLGREDVYDALDEAHMRERGIIEKRVGILTVIAFIAPLLGLFGTVVGIIQAFSAMAVAGGADPTAMLSGIAVALLTTAFGIIVAVPAAITYGMFSGRVDAISAEIEIGSKNLVIALSEYVWKKSGRTRTKKSDE
ncbi:MotA/TolQ/ExbB proton channel family protein [candidate division WOR-3 bacterium]|nr:MotA/TolQ/ExbB proton channel family protein [candidate division WOR-3 bacterium]